MIIQESIWRDVLRMVVWFPVRWLVPYLPLGISFSLFRLMGSLLFAFSSGKRKIVYESMNRELKNDYSQSRLIRETEKYFQNHILNSLFPLVLRQFTPQYLDSQVTVSGLEHLESALADGNGCIIAQGHLGIVQFPLLYLHHLGFKVGQVYYRHVEGLSWIGRKTQLKYREEYEKDLKAHMFPINTFQRPLYRWLKQNNILFLSGDGIGGREFIGFYSPFPFFSSMTLLPTGLYSLSQRLNTPLVPLHVVLSENRFHLVFSKQLSTKKSGDEGVQDLAYQFHRFLEKHIRENPSNWHFWDGFQNGILRVGDADPIAQ